MKSLIGENVVKFRKMNGMSQKYLAEQIGLSSQGLSKIEKGIASPRGMTIEKIINVLAVTPNQLFGVEEMTEENCNLLLRGKVQGE